MNKSELLADIQAKSLKVVSTIEEADAAKNAAGVKMYMTHVMEQRGDVVQGRNIGWYTLDEGTAQEQAFYRDQVVAKNNARDAVIAYMKTLSPATYIRFSVLEVNEEIRSARVAVVKDNKDGTATEKHVFVFKNGTNPITHVELT